MLFFIKLRKSFSILHLLRVFITTACWSLSNAPSASVNENIWIFFFSLLMWWSFINWISNPLCTIEKNPTWSCCITLCVISGFDLLILVWRFLHLYSERAWFFPFSDVFVFSFLISTMLVSRTELLSIFYALIFWKRL